MPNYLHTKIEFLKGVGPTKAELLNKELSIFTLGDILRHFPFRYEDRSKVIKIKNITNDLPYIQIKGTINSLRQEGHGKSKRLICFFHDGESSIELIWFKGIGYFEKYITLGKEYICFGKPNFFNGKYSIVHPELSEKKGEDLTKELSIVAIYPLTEMLKRRRVDSKFIRECIIQILQSHRFNITDYLPKGTIEYNNLISRELAFLNIHRPKDELLLKQAQVRIKFDEFFLLQFKMALLNTERKIKLNGFVFGNVGESFNQYYDDYLGFELTNAQKRVIKEIRKDMNTGHQMNRLLQGDVGSGKTIVALLTGLIAIDNGFQVCIMAPTEILAYQHYESISKETGNLPIDVAILTGSTTKGKRNALLERLKNGEINIIIGTHALIEDRVVYKNLGLAIIDEQHRFGVVQRSKLWKKNQIPPHVLVMTATPIPRTLAMTVYGDLDSSIIDELPKGRKPVRTILRNDNDRLKIMHFVKEEVDAGRQVYFVFPLIEESDKLDLKDLMNGYGMVTDHFPLPKYQIGLMHGKLRPDEKRQVMELFQKGITNILISTTVIEVGVNIPNASVMVIENAERFGLSQLHQLRGRVGRGSDSSYCILVGSRKLSANAKERLNAMVETSNGFEIAAKDLKIRGPGNIEGIEQSGILDLKLADIIKDEDLLLMAREACYKILDSDPNLDSPNHMILKKYLDSRNKRLGWSRIS